jgi:hypothetical protein
LRLGAREAEHDTVAGQPDSVVAALCREFIPRIELPAIFDEGQRPAFQHPRLQSRPFRRQLMLRSRANGVRRRQYRHLLDGARAPGFSADVVEQTGPVTWKGRGRNLTTDGSDRRAIRGEGRDGR